MKHNLYCENTIKRKEPCSRNGGLCHGLDVQACCYCRTQPEGGVNIKKHFIMLQRHSQIIGMCLWVCKCCLTLALYSPVCVCLC